MTPENMLALQQDGTTSWRSPLRCEIGPRVWCWPPIPPLRACPKRTGERHRMRCASPRAGQALLGMAMSLAFLEGRSHIGMVDLRRVARPVSAATGCCPRSNFWPVVVIRIPSSTIWCGPFLGSMRHEVW